MASLVVVPQAREQEGVIDPADEQSAQSERLYLPALSSDNACGPRLSAVPNEYIVVWREGATPQALADGVAVVSGLSAIGVQIVDLSALTQAGGETAANDALALLRANPEIEAVEPSSIADVITGTGSRWTCGRINVNRAVR